ncbi:hypothetical protein [Streptomyces hydrogenans]|uniref:hypothetical protein n=1 Tax=Streptomyces hydrogenans TaxID=1873719 RepID=UPI00342D3215
MTTLMPVLTPAARRLLQAIADQQDSAGAYFAQAGGGTRRMEGSDFTTTKKLLRQLREQELIVVDDALTHAAVTYTGILWLAAHTGARKSVAGTVLGGEVPHFEGRCRCGGRTTRARVFMETILAEASVGAHVLSLALGGDAVQLRTAGPVFRFALLESGSSDFLDLLGQALIHGGGGGLVLRTIRPGARDRVQGWRFCDRFTPLTATEIAGCYPRPAGESELEADAQVEFCTAFRLASTVTEGPAAPLLG